MIDLQIWSYIFETETPIYVSMTTVSEVEFRRLFRPSVFLQSISTFPPFAALFAPRPLPSPRRHPSTTVPGAVLFFCFLKCWPMFAEWGIVNSESAINSSPLSLLNPRSQQHPLDPCPSQPFLGSRALLSSRLRNWRRRILCSVSFITFDYFPRPGKRIEFCFNRSPLRKSPFLRDFSLISYASFCPGT